HGGQCCHSTGQVMKTGMRVDVHGQADVRMPRELLRQFWMDARSRQQTDVAVPQSVEVAHVAFAAASAPCPGDNRVERGVPFLTRNASLKRAPGVLSVPENRRNSLTLRITLHKG